jgi:serine/threonine protein kinase
VAHQAGIVHRDVKPSNILVTQHGQVKLSDFGIARAHSDVTLTQTGLMSGSPAYLSPEVASGSSATAASDVWALGATLYHALTGRPPFDVGDNIMGALYQIVHSDPPRPENAGWLMPLLEATMTKDPAQRWSMDQVRDFLADDDRTRVAPAAAPERTAEPTTILPAAAPSASAGTARTDRPVRDRRGRPGWLLPVLLAGVLVLLLGLGLWALRPGDGDRPDTAADETQSASPSETPDESEDAEPTPSESASETTEPSAEEMEAFVGDYLSTVTTDPDTSWTWLTPQFQRASGGIEDYKAFWSTIQSAELEDVQADPESMTVSYTATYTKTSGDVTTEDNSLGLKQRGDQYLIASED